MIELGRRHLRELGRREDARIGAENIDAPKLLHRCLGHRRAALGGGHIRRKPRRMRTNPRSHLVRIRLAAGDCKHVDARPPETQRDTAPDAPRGAGNNDGFTLQRFQHRNSWGCAAWAKCGNYNTYMMQVQHP